MVGREPYHHSHYHHHHHPNRQTLTELWLLLLAAGCLYFCSLIIAHINPQPQSELSERPLLESPETSYHRRHQKIQSLQTQVRKMSQNLKSLQLDIHGNLQRNAEEENLATRSVLQENVTGNGSNVQNRTKISPDQFVLAINQPMLCHQVDNDDDVAAEASDNREVYLFIIVHSHPSHKRRRNAIRETWGRVVRLYDERRPVVLMFLLGLPKDYEEYAVVKKEARLYRDVVMYDFVEDYRNLSTKSLLGLYWTSQHCRNARYVMKADDDVYLNIPYFLDELGKYPAKDLLLGSVNPQSPVKRYGQWRVDYRDYPHVFFPAYCSGCTYVLSGDMASKLCGASQTSPPPPLVPVEDVYITGLLAGRLGVRCVHHGQFPTWITVPSVRYVQRFLQRSLLGLHGVDWIRMHSVWEMVHKCPNCSSDLRQTQKWLSWLMDMDPMYR